jgi:hypothetical protein
VNLRLDARIVGLLVAALGATQLLLVLVALAFGDPPLPYLASGALCVGSGGGRARPARPPRHTNRPPHPVRGGGAGGGLGGGAGGPREQTARKLGPRAPIYRTVAG